MSVVTDDVWRFVLERDGFKCLRCNSEENLQPAHFHPRSLAGSNDVNNIMSLCNDCHRLHTIGKLLIRKINGKFFFG